VTRAGTPTAIAIAIACAGGAACFSPDYGTTPFTCVKSTLCPEGYACVQGVCRRAGRDGPVGVDGPRPERRSADRDPSFDLGDGELRAPDLPRPDTARDSPQPACPPGYCLVPAGTFVMGSPASEPCREPDNDPLLKETAHGVTLTRGLCLGCFEVTQKEFKALMGYNPSQCCDVPGSCSSAFEKHPVEELTWHEAAAYCNALTASPADRCYSCSGSGASVKCSTQVSDLYACKGFRLPTEAEWERAYRAGSQTALYNGPIASCTGSDANASAIGWYGEASYATHPVGQKLPNAWGLHDMAGNAWETIHDARVADLGSGAATDPVQASSLDGQRVIRGGATYKQPSYLRGAQRQDIPPTYRPAWVIGVRCARTKQP
jgi:formylglycine-generating enzyme required for sulfatase activity